VAVLGFHVPLDCADVSTVSITDWGVPLVMVYTGSMKKSAELLIVQLVSVRLAEAE